MHVTEARLVEKTHFISGTKKMIPHTFFALTAAEQMLYTAFRKKREDIHTAFQTVHGKEREEHEQDLQRTFLNLVEPYLTSLDVQPATCYIYSGEDRQTLVTTPRYALFEDADPFTLTAKASYWFTTKDEHLSCITQLDFTSERPHRQLIHDLVHRVSAETLQDGINPPFLSFGEFIHYAPTTFTVPLIQLVQDVLTGLGSEIVNTLDELCRAYYSHLNGSDSPDTNIHVQVYKEAYKRRFETELLRIGKIKQQFVCVS